MYKENQFLGSFMGKEMLGNTATKEYLDFLITDKTALENKNRELEVKQFELGVLKNRGFWKRVFNYYV